MPHPYWEKTQTSFERFRKKISGLNHYPRAGLIASGISVGLIILLYCFGLPPELIFISNIEVGPLVLTFFSTIALIAHLFSNATYVAGTIDLFNETDLDIKRKTKVERWSTLIGILIGLTVGIALASSLPLTFFSFLSTVTVTTGASAGLGSRLGGLTRRPFLLEKIFLGVSCVVGIFMGSCLVLTGTTPLIHIAGVITFLTGGPPLCASIVFVCFITSLCMSGADYFSKMIIHGHGLINRLSRWLRGLPPPDKNSRHHEYEGSFFGAILSIIAITFFITHLHLLASAVLAQEGCKLGAAITVTLVAKCFGVDGIFSRVGRTLDSLFDEDDKSFDKAAKVMLVITGVAGLIVVWDMCKKMINYLSCKKTVVAPSTDPTPSTPSGTELQTTTQTTLLSPTSPLSLRSASPSTTPSPSTPSSQPFPSPVTSSPKSPAQSPSTSWWDTLPPLSCLWAAFYSPTRLKKASATAEVDSTPRDSLNLL